MHVLKLRSAQHLSGFACTFYGWTVHYGCGGMVQAELKKEMGLQHVSGDHNHRKQEHNCLEYTDSRKCTAGQGQEDRERERERWMELRSETEICCQSIKSQDGDKEETGTFFHVISL